MFLNASDVSWLKTELDWWELGEYAATAVVGLGCLGEFFAEFTRLPRLESSRHKLGRLSLVLVIAGIAGELCATVRTSGLSGQIIAQVERSAGDATTSAENAAGAAQRANDSARQASEEAVNARLAATVANTLALNGLKQAGQARQELAEYKSPRILTDQQAEAIADKLRQFSGQEFEVNTYWDAPEPMAFSQRIADILVGAGWSLRQPTGFHALFGGVIGVQVWLNPLADDTAKAAANSLIDSLKSEGIPTILKLQAAGSPKTDKIHLSIGTKH